MRGNALMAWSFGWEEGLAVSGNHWQAPYLAQLLEDRYDAVRFIAERSLRRLPGFQELQYDFVGRPEQRRRPPAGAVDLGWRTISQERPFAAPVLIDRQGRVQQTPFQRLWKLRDDRPMAVKE